MSPSALTREAGLGICMGSGEKLLFLQTPNVKQDRSCWRLPGLCPLPWLALLLTGEATSMEHLFLIQTIQRVWSVL